MASTAVKGLIQMDRYTDIDIYKRLHGGWLGWWVGRSAGGRMDRQTYREIDRQTDR